VILELECTPSVICEQYEKFHDIGIVMVSNDLEKIFKNIRNIRHFYPIIDIYFGHIGGTIVEKYHPNTKNEDHAIVRIAANTTLIHFISTIKEEKAWTILLGDGVIPKKYEYVFIMKDTTSLRRDTNLVRLLKEFKALRMNKDEEIHSLTGMIDGDKDILYTPCYYRVDNYYVHGYKAYYQNLMLCDKIANNAFMAYRKSFKEIKYPWHTNKVQKIALAQWFVYKDITFNYSIIPYKYETYETWPDNHPICGEKKYKKNLEKIVNSIETTTNYIRKVWLVIHIQINIHRVAYLMLFFLLDLV